MTPLVTFGNPMIGQEERDAVADVLRRRRLTQGGLVAQFEERFQDYVGGGAAVAVSSCMAALHIAWLLRGIGPGDAVVVPALTHVATANAVELMGARPIFVDVHCETGNLDPDLVPAEGEVALPRHGRRIVGLAVVHFLGHPGYMRSLADLSRQHGLFLVEDCALALGCRHEFSGLHVGLIGDAGCFSFYPVKHITTGEGGMFLTKHPELAERARQVRNFGLDGSGDAICLGSNYRMTEIQAAIGLMQLVKLPQMKKMRARNAKMLQTALAEFAPIGADYAVSVAVPDGHDRDKVRHAMWVRGIETSVYYARPVPDMTYYRRKYGECACPVARRFCERRITLSTGPHISAERMRLQIREFKRALTK